MSAQSAARRPAISLYHATSSRRFTRGSSATGCAICYTTPAAPTAPFFLDQQPLELTAAQFRLLSHLYQNVGNLCTRESCAAAIWGRDYDPGMDACRRARPRDRQPAPPYQEPRIRRAGTIQYSDVERGPTIAETLALYFWDGGRWVKELSSTMNSAAHAVSTTPAISQPRPCWARRGGRLWP